MSIDSRLNWIRSFLRSLNSPLGDFRPFGIAWSFFRALAAAENEMEMAASQLRRDFDYRTATGGSLEALAALHGIYRLQATHATGKVLARSDVQQRLSPNMVFSTFDQSIQLVPVMETNISSVERAVSFRTLTRSNAANLPAGTPVFSSFSSSGTFLVGEARNAGDIVGGFSGGLDAESDASLRRRLQRVLIGDSIEIMRSAIRQRFPGSFFQVQDNDPIPGVFTVYAFDVEDSFIRTLDEFVANQKPIGSIHLVKPVRRQPVNIVLSGITPELAFEELNVYFNGFLVGQAFEPQFLMEFLGSRGRLVAPLTRVSPRQGSVLVLGSIRIA